MGEILGGAGGVLSGIGTLCLGVAALIPHLYKFKKQKLGKGSMRSSHFRALTLLPGILLLLISAGIFVTHAFVGQGQHLNLQLTSQAWDALNRADYGRAISYTERCDSEFHDEADRLQMQLEKDRAPLPPNGQVSEQDKRTLFTRGPLNDVATCLYIKGRAAENLNRKEEAIQAYQAASKYTYARSWDPRGWFWSPSEVAVYRSTLLK